MEWSSQLDLWFASSLRGANILHALGQGLLLSQVCTDHRQILSFFFSEQNLILWRGNKYTVCTEGLSCQFISPLQLHREVANSITLVG